MECVCNSVLLYYTRFPVSQQISSHQEQFIQMLNEPVQEAGQGGGGGVAEAGGGQMNYIQVTPQEKEAIERVKHALSLKRKLLRSATVLFGNSNIRLFKTCINTHTRRCSFKQMMEIKCTLTTVYNTANTIIIHQQ